MLKLNIEYMTGIKYYSLLMPNNHYLIRIEYYSFTATSQVLFLVDKILEFTQTKGIKLTWISDNCHFNALLTNLQRKNSAFCYETARKFKRSYMKILFYKWFTSRNRSVCPSLVDSTPANRPCSRSPFLVLRPSNKVRGCRRDGGGGRRRRISGRSPPPWPPRNVLEAF